ncbi:hypothetical protein A8924_0490 [Saccharopolyspora erythraea NRRL 2338]|uniref:Uncharacterized protein n=2 Tax=Saccharopolyspora erythraea TaxID=1836 RepID=A4F5Y4_SACEN|nr:hypothetical protein [Saccharopolyspora erythraea]EQD83994.1 hypothetical protein N599_22310 [Saccharopolyspora erythraea D]PFG93257.1 hypothetical protein A8924_0490 [Saccharopolyspora erythraea NRRL 2338]QRK90109.1 hypothetical protein JQX30_00515 [Saccharopolyspora erythraea]CAL99458.1 hypothetical protein SACE_0105 [Saccharopolyspora erythraea NRRL 2338]
MTWQDELQHLDAELAAGRISAEEYRNRRDVALGRAQAQSGPTSGGFPQQDPQSGGFPQQDPQSGGFPQQQPGQADPFPPAFNWGAAAQGVPQPGPQGPQPPAGEESTQIVHNPMLQQPPAQHGGDSESTQVVNLNQAPQQQWPGQQQGQQQWPQQQGWSTSDNPGTPWGDELPPAEHGDTSWMRQGPEVFESAGKSSKGKLVAGLSIGGVLLAGVIVAGVFYFTSGGEEQVPDAQGTTQQQEPPPTTSALPEPPAAKPAPPATSQEVLIASPGGPPHLWNGALDPALLSGPRAGLLQPQQVRDFALQNGFADGWFVGTEGAPRSTLLALRMPDQNTASGLVKKYLESQQGLSTVDELSYQGVQVKSAGNVFRTAYVVHNWAVIIDVGADDKAAAQQQFQTVLGQQLQQSPPTVRE